MEKLGFVETYAIYFVIITGFFGVGQIIKGFVDKDESRKALYVILAYLLIFPLIGRVFKWW